MGWFFDFDFWGWNFPDSGTDWRLYIFILLCPAWGEKVGLVEVGQVSHFTTIQVQHI
jgi:hypothetical protein